MLKQNDLARIILEPKETFNPQVFNIFNGRICRIVELTDYSIYSDSIVKILGDKIPDLERTNNKIKCDLKYLQKINIDNSNIVFKPIE